MAMAKVTSKGQVTIPKEIRERLGIRPGDELEFVEVKGTYQLRKHVSLAALEKYRGYLKDLAGKDPDELVREMRGE